LDGGDVAEHIVARRSRKKLGIQAIRYLGSLRSHIERKMGTLRRQIFKKESEEGGWKKKLVLRNEKDDRPTSRLSKTGEDMEERACLALIQRGKGQEDGNI